MSKEYAQKKNGKKVYQCRKINETQRKTARKKKGQIL